MTAKVPNCVLPASTAAAAGFSCALATRSHGPSNITKVTNTPTVTNATSLTIDSVAIARISPC